MLTKNIFLKNNFKKNSNFKNISTTKKFFLKLKKDYEENKIPLLKSFTKKYQLGYSKKIIKNLSKEKNIILVGMGGSILGAKAIYSFLKPKIKKNFLFQDNLSERSNIELNLRKIKNTAYIFISKSGNTIETVANINLILQNNKKINNKIFITENKKNAISEISESLKTEIIEHKNFIGGRYSVMSEVGMLPAELMGLNIKKFKNLNHLIKNKNFVQNLVENVNSLYNFYREAKTNLIILNYDQDMTDLSYWYQQLIAESLGKHGKGFLPLVSTVPKDNHSLLQLYLDGPRNNFFTIFQSKHVKKTELKKFYLPKSLKYLTNKSIENILDAKTIATEKAFTKKNIPFRTFYFSKKNEQELGAIFTFFVLETILLSRLMKVNPFNQPSVEIIKNETKKILLRN